MHHKKRDKNLFREMIDKEIAEDNRRENAINKGKETLKMLDEYEEPQWSILSENDNIKINDRKRIDQVAKVKRKKVLKQIKKDFKESPNLTCSNCGKVIETKRFDYDIGENKPFSIKVGKVFCRDKPCQKEGHRLEMVKCRAKENQLKDQLVICLENLIYNSKEYSIEEYNYLISITINYITKNSGDSSSKYGGKFVFLRGKLILGKSRRIERLQEIVNS